MKSINFFVLLLFTTCSTAFGQDKSPINWITFEKFNADGNNDKTIIVYIYSEHCKNCKLMRHNTLSNEEISSYINDKMVPIHINAESKEEISFRGKTYGFTKTFRSGYNELAIELTKERLILPSTVILDSDLNIIQSIPGVKSPSELHPILIYFAEDHYKKTPWKVYKSNYHEKNCAH